MKGVKGQSLSMCFVSKCLLQYYQHQEVLRYSGKILHCETESYVLNIFVMLAQRACMENYSDEPHDEADEVKTARKLISLLTCFHLMFVESRVSVLFSTPNYFEENKLFEYLCFCFTEFLLGSIFYL